MLQLVYKNLELYTFYTFSFFKCDKPVKMNKTLSQTHISLIKIFSFSFSL